MMNARTWLVAAFGIMAAAAPAQTPGAPASPLDPSAPVAPAPEGGSPVANPTVGPLEAAGMADVPLGSRQHMEDGFFEIRVGNAENAIRAFEWGLEIAPDHPRLLFGLGTALVTAKRHAQALEVFQRALKARPADHLILNNMAWVYATTPDPRLRNGAKALEFARRALLIAPEDHHVWSTMAEAYFVSGNFERAERCSREAVRIAQNAGVSPERLDEYRRQSDRCAAAALAMTILD